MQNFINKCQDFKVTSFQVVKGCQHSFDWLSGVFQNHLQLRNDSTVDSTIQQGTMAHKIKALTNFSRFTKDTKHFFWGTLQLDKGGFGKLWS